MALEASREVARHDLGVVEIELQAQGRQPQLLDQRRTFGGRIEQIARDVAGVDRLDQRLPAGGRHRLAGDLEVGLVGRPARFPGRALGTNPGHDVDLRAVERLGIGHGAIQRRAKIRLAAGQARKPALARGEIAGRRVDQQHRKPVRRQLGCEVGSLHLVGKLALDRRKARFARRRAPLEERPVGEHGAEIGGELRHASLPGPGLLFYITWEPLPRATSCTRRDEPDHAAHPTHARRAPGGIDPGPARWRRRPGGAESRARGDAAHDRAACAKRCRRARPRSHRPRGAAGHGGAAAPRLRARQHAGSGLRRPAAADRLQPDHLAAVHRRADDRSAGASSPDDVVLEVGTGSGYQAAVLAELVARGPQHRDHSGPGRDAPRSDWASRASRTSRPTWATATTASRPPPPSMPSWSPPPPPACRRP